jgi:integral membrane protein (TIGR01906 family)
MAKFAKYALVLAISFIVFSVAFNFYAFNSLFYKKEFERYGVYEKAKNADSLHNSVVMFLKGKSNVLPDEFNQNEKSHLEDVRSVIKNLNGMFYFFVIVYAVLFFYLSKKEKEWKKCFAEALMYSGIFTIVFGLMVCASMLFSFSFAFDSMHKILFPQGNYAFDPSKEIIVNLYPEQLFMNLGLRIGMATFIISIILIIAGRRLRK